MDALRPFLDALHPFLDALRPFLESAAISSYDIGSSFVGSSFAAAAAAGGPIDLIHGLLCTTVHLIAPGLACLAAGFLGGLAAGLLSTASPNRVWLWLWLWLYY